MNKLWRSRFKTVVELKTNTKDKEGHKLAKSEKIKTDCIRLLEKQGPDLF